MMVKRIRSMQIKPSNPMYSYFLEMTHLSKNLYNEANFLYRQVLSGCAKEESLRHCNETQSIHALNSVLESLNTIRKRNGTTPFRYLDKDNCFLPKYHLDGFLKLSKQVDYTALPAQCNQRTISILYDNWNSYFESIKDYEKNPSKYLGKPKPPRYAKKNGYKVCVFTNQICLIKKDQKGTYLKLPKTKERYYLGDLDFTGKTLKEVRIVPRNQHVNLELVYETEVEDVKEKEYAQSNVAAIDLGLENLTLCAPLVLPWWIIQGMVPYYSRVSKSNQ